MRPLFHGRRVHPRLVSGLAVLGLAGVAAAQSPAPPAMDRDDIVALTRELSNWGRWDEEGGKDQLGAIRLITPEKRQQAAGLVRDGVCVSLARIAATTSAADNNNPFEHRMLFSGAEPLNGQWCLDLYSVAYHGYAHTHIDALCHIFSEGKMFNGFPQEHVTPSGTRSLGIELLREGIFTRGVLFDIPRLKGVDSLEPGTAILTRDLDAWEEKAGVRVSSGDVVFIRTGRWARRAKEGPWDVETAGAAGLHASTTRWLRERDVAMVGSDAASDVLPSGIEGVSHPVHLILLYAMGVAIFDNCDLEELARVAAAKGRWEFLLTAAPFPVAGGTGSPLNPIATF